ncbi:MAG: hypothetical protein U5L06_06220 [Rhodovibrio sp.]|nr:hypothetical protein [Rhodovibrio sp.]
MRPTPRRCASPATLAEAQGAQLTALAPVPAPSARLFFDLTHDPEGAAQGAYRQRAYGRLQARRRGRAAWAAGRRWKCGSASRSWRRCTAVIDGGHDLAIKAAEELDGLARHLLASTDQHLLRKCPATVWLHRSAARCRRRSRVLAAVDVDPDPLGEPDTEAALNRRIVWPMRRALAELGAGPAGRAELLGSAGGRPGQRLGPAARARRTTPRRWRPDNGASWTGC